LVSEYSRILAVAPVAVKYRKMSRRWGSCRSDGVITLNRRLCFLPDRLVAYVVFHELLHLRLRRHDVRFKQRMRDHFPDAAARDAELEIYGYRLLYRSSPLGGDRWIV
jgi:predicted metal-dependent hydrolase